ncbi:GDP-mannose 4,6-dehydratase, partial [Jeotgalibaca porci]|uniref:GDP-mannose 4,6-dehydratase n=1 Tax=Jeotgalibaca porci TaxID=1868793 RepID=UPI0035A0BB35
ESFGNYKGVGTYNLGTGIGYSVLDLVKNFQQANDIVIPYKLVERRPGGVATCYADATRAKEILGWSAEKNLEDMCRDSWRWQSENPKGFDK